MLKLSEEVRGKVNNKKLQAIYTFLLDDVKFWFKIHMSNGFLDNFCKILHESSYTVFVHFNQDNDSSNSDVTVK